MVFLSLRSITRKHLKSLSLKRFQGGLEFIPGLCSLEIWVNIYICNIKCGYQNKDHSTAGSFCVVVVVVVLIKAHLTACTLKVWIKNMLDYQSFESGNI